jgi:hypothetical protein
MKADEIFWPVLIALVVSAQVAGKRKSETLTAYYDDGTRILFHADAVTQSVATFQIGANGRPLGNSPGGVIHGCQVGDFENWSCPAVTTTDGEAVAKYGFTQAVDGDISISDREMLKAPIPWYRWELRKTARLFGTKG